MRTIKHHTHHARAHTHMHLDDVHLSLSLSLGDTHLHINIVQPHLEPKRREPLAHGNHNLMVVAAISVLAAVVREEDVSHFACRHRKRGRHSEHLRREVAPALSAHNGCAQYRRHSGHPRAAGKRTSHACARRAPGGPAT